jgi:hypothetical protein
MHRFAAVFGGIGACMGAGFVIVIVAGALAIDWTGKAVLNLIAVVWMAGLGRTLQGQTGRA